MRNSSGERCLVLPGESNAHFKLRPSDQIFPRGGGSCWPPLNSSQRFVRGPLSQGLCQVCCSLCPEHCSFPQSSQGWAPLILIFWLAVTSSREIFLNPIPKSLQVFFAYQFIDLFMFVCMHAGAHMCASGPCIYACRSVCVCRYMCVHAGICVLHASAYICVCVHAGTCMCA